MNDDARAQMGGGEPYNIVGEIQISRRIISILP